MLAVFYNGTIKWVPSAIYRSSCKVNMYHYPFDQQTCSFKFGSWTHDGNKLDMQFQQNYTDIDLREFKRSTAWDIVNTSAYRQVRYYPCCGDDPYPELVYQVTMRRRMSFNILALVLPCLLLSALTLLMFWFPPGRPDRTGLGTSTNSITCHMISQT